MPPSDPNAEFYDGLAENYHRMYDDWWSFATHYTGVLAELLAAEGVKPPAEVLDVTCGIGTQALPLAALGYRVTGSDLSEGAVRRARREAASRGLDAEFVTGDVRRIAEQGDSRYDAALSGSNSLTHLLTDEDLRQALSSVHRRLRPGGVFLATIRDYDPARPRERPGAGPRGLRQRGRAQHRRPGLGLVRGPPDADRAPRAAAQEEGRRRGGGGLGLHGAHHGLPRPAPGRVRRGPDRHRLRRHPVVPARPRGPAGSGARARPPQQLLPARRRGPGRVTGDRTGRTGRSAGVRTRTPPEVRLLRTVRTVFALAVAAAVATRAYELLR